MGTLRLIRHGQASYGASNYDVLSERGVEQARALGAAWARAGLVVDGLYTGPMQRQVDTARHLRAAAADAGHALPEPIVVAELAEYPAFELLGRFLPAIVRDEPDLAGLLDGSAPRGDRGALIDRAFWRVVDAWTGDRLDCGELETFGGFVARVDRGLDGLIARHPGSGQRIAAVTSGGPIGVAAKLALGLEARATVELWRMVRNASVNELLWRVRDGQRQLSLLGWNHVDHLADELHTFR